MILAEILERDMRVYFSDDLIIEEEAPSTKDNWIFVQAEGAYAAVRGLHGTYSWDDNNFIRFAVDTTPVIIEVLEKENIDYQLFKTTDYQSSHFGFSF